MLSFSAVSRSLLIFMAVVVAVAAAFGHLYEGVGIALFVFFLAGIDAKPSWKRIWNPDRKGEGGVWRTAHWKTAGTTRSPKQR